jgi:hypothetical protein
MKGSQPKQFCQRSLHCIWLATGIGLRYSAVIDTAISDVTVSLTASHACNWDPNWLDALKRTGLLL